MKVVILCGGLGTRLSEETSLKPKPMVSIGGLPILWHIMNIYGAYGFNHFICALGYKGDVIKDYFINYHAFNSDISINLAKNEIKYIRPIQRDWSIDLIETGSHSQTGGRLLRLKEILKNEETFMLTYGDGLANINLKELLDFHKSHGKIATVSAVRPPARFGNIIIEHNAVKEFKEKPQTGEGWINGGFFVFNKEIFKYLENDQSVLEKEPLERLVADMQLMSYCHDEFWQCMDTLRDKNFLEELWSNTSRPPWKVWNES